MRYTFLLGDDDEPVVFEGLEAVELELAAQDAGLSVEEYARTCLSTCLALLKAGMNT